MSFDLGSIVAHVKADVTDFQKGMGSVSDTVKTVSGGLKDAGTKMSAFITAPIIGAGIAAIKTAAEFETLQTSFSTMLGGGSEGAEKAKKMLQELKSFSDATPFTPEEVNQSARSLLAYGTQADNVQSTLKKIGDVASGTNTPLGEMATLFGKMKSQQIIFTEDLNQLADRGIPILDILAEKYKTNVVGIREMASQGELSFTDIDEAFGKMSSEGGIFFDMMDQQSQTVAGRFSTLQGEVQTLALKIGEMLLPFVSMLVEKAVQLVAWFSSLDENQQKLILVAIGLAAALGPVLLILSALITAVTLIASPIGLLIIGVVALGLAWSTNFMGIRDITMTMWGIVRPILEAIFPLFSIIINGVIWLATQFKNNFGAISQAAGTMWSTITTLFSQGRDTLKSIGDAIYNAIIGPFNRARDAVNSAMNEIREKMKDLNPLQRHSPSVVDLVSHGVDALLSEFDRLGSIAMPSAGQAIGVGAGAGGGVGGGFNQNVSIYIDKVGDQQDVQAMGRELGFRTGLNPGVFEP